MAITTAFVLAVFAEEVDAELEMRALHLAIDRLADIVQERGAHRHVRVEPDFLGHDAGETGHFRRVREHVLTVARPILQAPHQPQNFRVQVVQAELERHSRALLADFLVGLVLHLLNDFFDARGVDPAVGNQPLDRLLRDLAPIRIESREDDRAGRVVDDQIDAGGEFERADVAALTADDPAFEVVARQVDHRHGRLDGVLGGAALNGFGDVLLGFAAGRLARLSIEPLQEIGGIVSGVVLDLLEQELLRFVRRQARDALELVLLLGYELLVLLRRSSGLLFPVRDRSFSRMKVASRGVRSQPGVRPAARRAGQVSARR